MACGWSWVRRTCSWAQAAVAKAQVQAYLSRAFFVSLLGPMRGKPMVHVGRAMVPAHTCLHLSGNASPTRYASAAAPVQLRHRFPSASLTWVLWYLALTSNRKRGQWQAMGAGGCCVVLHRLLSIGGQQPTPIGRLLARKALTRTPTAATATSGCMLSATTATAALRWHPTISSTLASSSGFFLDCASLHGSGYRKTVYGSVYCT